MATKALSLDVLTLQFAIIILYASQCHFSVYYHQTTNTKK